MKKIKKWADLLNVEQYNMVEVRSKNVPLWATKKWLEIFEYYNISTNLDIILYAMEFASRSDGRYGEKILPKIPGNPLSGWSYGALMSKPTARISYENYKGMIEYIISKTRISTITKWKK